ncbi:hypothetical protein VTO73DRAFT_11371 [Trametes versicolor]
MSSTILQNCVGGGAKGASARGAYEKLFGGSGRTTCWRQRENSLARQMRASAREEIGADDGTRVVGMRRQEHGPELQG